MNSIEDFLYCNGSQLILQENSVYRIDEGFDRDFLRRLSEYETNVVRFYKKEDSSQETRVKPFEIRGLNNERLAIENNIVGFTVVDKKFIMILPKIFPLNEKGSLIKHIIAFYRLLDQVFNLSLEKYLNEININEYVERSGYEILLSLYARILYRELLRGVYREYREIINEEPYLRGKILLTHQILKPPYKQYLLTIDYHKLSVRNLLNKILYYAAYIGSNITKINVTRSLLKHILVILDESKTFNILTPIPEVQFNRLNIRFKPAYDLARIIINGLAEGTRRRAYGFFIDMSQLFQKYIYITLKKHLYKYIFEEEQEIGMLIKMDEEKYKQKPDICIRNKNREHILCIDVKYKSIEREGKLNLEVNDIRQAYVYLKLIEKKNQNIHSFVLIYPYFEEHYNSNIFKNNRMIRLKFNIEDRDQELYVIGFRMNHLIDGNKQDIREMTNSIREIIEKHSK